MPSLNRNTTNRKINTFRINRKIPVAHLYKMITAPTMKNSNPNQNNPSTTRKKNTGTRKLSNPLGARGAEIVAEVLERMNSRNVSFKEFGEALARYEKEKGSLHYSTRVPVVQRARRIFGIPSPPNLITYIKQRNAASRKLSAPNSR
jgi:hypothetical protein